MPYFLELGRLHQSGGVGRFGYKASKPQVTVLTLEEAKQTFKELNPFDYIPKWLEELEDPTEYLQVEDDIELFHEGSGKYSNWNISIEGNEYDKEVS